MKVCKQCGKEYSDDKIRFCIECGASFEEETTTESKAPEKKETTKKKAEAKKSIPEKKTEEKASSVEPSGEVCAKCGAPLEAGASFCIACGTSTKLGALNAHSGASAKDTQNQNKNQAYFTEPEKDQTSSKPREEFSWQQNGSQKVPPMGGNGGAYYVDHYDHTAEFDQKDIQDNKLYSMLPYLFGLVGVVVAKIVSKDSAFLSFHIKQGIKFVVAQCLTMFLAAVLCWTIIVPVAASIFLTVLFVIQIIAFVNVAKGFAKEPVVIRDIDFLR